MDKLKEFNIFSVLSKDDKELIHSAFLSFLIPRYSFIKDAICGSDFGEIKHICPEISYNYTVTLNRNGKIESKKKNVRFDIQIKNKSNTKTCIVENKFKCIPTRRQLETYSKAIEENIMQEEVEKVLICFSDSLVGVLPEDWSVISYQKIFDLIRQIKDFQSPKEKYFIKDYLSFLGNYLKLYQYFRKERLFYLFKNPQKEDNRFWLRLILSEILKNLHKHESKFNELRGPSTNAIPVIDLFSPNIKCIKDRYNFLIQLKGSRIELYCHYWNGTNGKKLVTDKIQRLKENNLERKTTGIFKKNIKDAGKSMYVYQENIVYEIGEDNFTLENIELYIIDFLNRLVVANRM